MRQMDRTLDKEAFKDFVAGLMEQGRLLGPTRKGGGTSSYSQAMFGPVNRFEDLDFGYRSLMVSPRKLLFPDNQCLYQFELGDAGVDLQDCLELWDGQRIFLGLRPCDITAMKCLDRIFLEDRYVEPTYKNRRENSLVIGLTCSQPQPYCFCNAVGSGPDCDESADLVMTDLGDRYFMRALTDKGRELISGDAFKDATDQDLQKREEALAAALEALPDELDLAKLPESMKANYGHELWDKYTDDCVSCGACNMVCPTCHCFTFLDKTNLDRDRGRRVLAWDACHFERFAQMAGEINTRGEKSARYKHRLYDKFLYDPQRHGNVFCVGCGRCVEFCPAHINILEVLTRLEEVAQ